MRFAAVIVAAGSGSRAGGETPKQWRDLLGRPVIRWSAEALLAAGAERLVVVVARDGHEAAAQALAGLPNWRAVEGGAIRADSVRVGLAALSGAPVEAVLIHDAARPFVTSRHVDALLDALKQHAGALPALAVSDTLKREGSPGVVAETASRAGLWRAQTPQAFHLQALIDAYAALPPGTEPTDDCQVVEQAGGTIALVPGDPRLMKLTYAEDFPLAEAIARAEASSSASSHAGNGAVRLTRMGQGVDAHRWGPGESVWLCGVEIAHAQTLIGHSDADAGLHAITDAILGAIGEGDIGDHFPPTDPQLKGAPSDLFLKHAAALVAAHGGRIVNVDVTLICEQPKIKPHRAAMRARLAEILSLPLDRISVKATTTEGMGFTGRGEGLAALAIAAVETPG